MTIRQISASIVAAILVAGCDEPAVTGPSSLPLPSPPQISSVVAGDRQVAVHFSPPRELPVLWNYDYSIDSGRTWIHRAPASIESPAVITGLENGMRYGVMLRSVNATGAGEPSNTVVGEPALGKFKVSVIRQVRRPGLSYYIPQRLDSLGSLFALERDRALQRYQSIRGRPASTLFEKVQAAADYVANMAKHPYRHSIGQEYSHPRIWENLDYPERMLTVAQENQAWNGEEWLPEPGKTENDVRAVECTFQHFLLGGIVNTMGAQWMVLSITAHDAFTYYDPEIGKWVYIESTFNEHYRRASESDSRYTPLSPEELRKMNMGGDNSAVAIRHPYQPQRSDLLFPLKPYLTANPLGFQIMAVNINGRTVGARNSAERDSRIFSDSRSLFVFDSLLKLGWGRAEPDEDIWAPQGELFLDSLAYTSRGQVVHLSTNLAVTQPIFERKTGDGTWEKIGKMNELGSATGAIRFRARHNSFVSGELVLVQAPPDT